MGYIIGLLIAILVVNLTSLLLFDHRLCAFRNELVKHQEEQAGREQEMLSLSRSAKQDMNYLMKPHRAQQAKETAEAEQRLIEAIRYAFKNQKPRP